MKLNLVLREFAATNAENKRIYGANLDRYSMEDRQEQALLIHAHGGQVVRHGKVARVHWLKHDSPPSPKHPNHPNTPS